MKEILWKNNVNFVKDVTMTYANFFLIVIIVSEKKVGGIIFVQSLLFFIKLF
jgi:hypothetical protein